MIFKLIGGLALCAALSASAAEFTFGALGDTPYTWFEEAHFPGLLDGMSREDLAFVVHVGDFKGKLGTDHNFRHVKLEKRGLSLVFSER